MELPSKRKSDCVTVCTPDHVFAPLRSGIVPPLVPVAVEHPVAPLERLEHEICEPPTSYLLETLIMPAAGAVSPTPSAARLPIPEDVHVELSGAVTVPENVGDAKGATPVRVLPEKVIVLLVKVCVPAKFTKVSVAAGMLTVTVPSAPVAGSKVRSPDVALPIAMLPSVPDFPNCGVDE